MAAEGSHQYGVSLNHTSVDLSANTSAAAPTFLVPDQVSYSTKVYLYVSVLLGLLVPLVAVLVG